MQTIVRISIALAFLCAAHGWADDGVYPPARGLATNVLVIRGALISKGKEAEWPRYRISEVGRGGTSAREIALCTSLLGHEYEQPTDAILLFNAGASDQEPKGGTVFLPLVSRDPNDAIFSYSLNVWEELRAKSDAELADTPMDKWMPMRDALKIVYHLAREKYVGNEIFFLPARRRSYGWIITVFRVHAPYLDTDYYTVMDSGKVFLPNMSCGLLVKPNEDISTPEKLETYLQDRYKDSPDEMPRRFEELYGE